MRISERLLTVLACCLLAVAIPAGAGGKSERELLQARELLDKAQEAIKPANDLLGRRPLAQADYDAAVKIAAQVMEQYLGPAMTLIGQATARKPNLPEVPSTIMKLARTLVDAKQYGTAIGWLVQAMKDYPDWRETVDELVARIMSVQERYNATYREFLDAVKNENAEQALVILEELKRINPYPDPAIKRSLAAAERRLRGQAEFNRFDAVMDAAAQQLAEGKQPEAIATYLDGFSIGRSDFDGADYPRMLRDQALAAVARIQDAARAVSAAQAGLPKLPTALEDLLRRPVTESARQRFLSTLSALAQARMPEQQARAAAVAVREVNAAIDAANGDAAPSDLWLSFIEWYALGRPDMPPEGIAFAIRQPWVKVARSLSDTATAAADAAGSAMEAAFTAERITPVDEFRTLAQEARGRGALAIGVLDAEAPVGTTEEGFRPSAEDTARATELSTRLARLRQFVADADAREAFVIAEASAGDDLAALQLRFTTASLAPAADAATLARGRNEMATIRESAAAGAVAWAARAGSAPAGSVMNARASAVEGRFDDLRSRAVAADAAFAVRIATLEAATFESRLMGAVARQARGRALAAGIAGSQAPVGKRPDLANEEYAPAVADLGALVATIDDWQTRWASEPASVSGSEGIARLAEDQRDLRGRAVALQAAIAADMTAADAAVATANQYRGQGDSAFASAQTHEKEKRYEAAGTEYETALTSYGASLEQMENATVRNRYTELPKLIANVKQLIARQTIVDVERQVNEGVAQYKSTDFSAAVATLEKAKAQWDAAYPDPKDANDTLEFYLGLARSAKKLSGRREITRTDPIYQDVRGFMTQAELSYNDAVSLKKTSGSPEEYRKNLEAAKSSVEAITTAVPEYREARLMDLKITRLEQGEERFAASLRQLVQEALRKANLAKARDPSITEVTMRDTRLALLDYLDIEGVNRILSAAVRDQIRAAIVVLEERLGMRVAKPSPPDIQRARTLYNEARALYNADPGNRSVWEQALQKLKEALALDYDTEDAVNKNARALQREIIAKRGGSLEDLLTPDENRRYLEANNLIAQNDLPRAEAIINELLAKKPRNGLLLRALAQIKVLRGEQ